MLPEFIIGDERSGSDHDYVVHLRRPRFVARIQSADEAVCGDWCWVAPGIERLVVVDWIDRPDEDRGDLLRRAAVEVELSTMDACDCLLSA